MYFTHSHTRNNFFIKQRTYYSTYTILNSSKKSIQLPILFYDYLNKIWFYVIVNISKKGIKLMIYFDHLLRIMKRSGWDENNQAIRITKKSTKNNMAPVNTEDNNQLLFKNMAYNIHLLKRHLIDDINTGKWIIILRK